MISASPYAWSLVPAQRTAAPVGVVFTNTASDPGVHTGKIGLNYRWGAPVVAKY